MEQKKQFSDDHMFRKKPNAFLVKKLSAPSKKGRAESGKQPSNPSTKENTMISSLQSSNKFSDKTDSSLFTKASKKAKETGGSTREDITLQSIDSSSDKIISLLDMCRQNEEILSRYDDDNSSQNISDDESSKKLQQMEKEIDKIYLESDEEQALKLIDQRLESLVNMSGMFDEREMLKNSLLLEVNKVKDDPNIEFPVDYEEVVERVSNDLQREIQTDAFAHADAEHQRGEEFMQRAQQKLATTMYSFSKGAVTSEAVGKTVDEAKVKALARIRELDRRLAIAEREEKNVKEMLRRKREKEKEKESQATFEQDEIKENSQSLSENNSFVSQSSSSSTDSKRLFITKNKRKTAQKGGTNKKKTILDPMDDDVMSQLSKSNSSRTSRTSGSKKKNFIKMNKENAFLDEHEQFINSMTPKEQIRYKELMGELEESIKVEDETGKLFYKKIPDPFQDYFDCNKNNELEAKIEKDLLEEARTAPKVDSLRIEDEMKSMRDKVAEIDARFKELDSTNPSEEHEIAIQKMIEQQLNDEEYMALLREKINFSEYNEMERLDEEAKSLAQRLDSENVLEELEQLQKECESISMQIEANKSKELEEFYYTENVEHRNRLEQQIRTILEQAKTSIEAIISDKDNSDAEAILCRIEQTYKDICNRIDETADHVDQLTMGVDEAIHANRYASEILKEVKVRDPENLEAEIDAELQVLYPELFDPNSFSEELYIKWTAKAEQAEIEYNRHSLEIKATE